MPHRKLSKLKPYRHWSEDTKSTIATLIAMLLVIGLVIVVGVATR